MDVSLLDMVIATFSVITALAVLFCICCVYMKISDMKMKKYIIELAKQQGIKVDPDNLDSRHKTDSQDGNENCTIMIPEVGVIL